MCRYHVIVPVIVEDNGWAWWHLVKCMYRLHGQWFYLYIYHLHHSNRRSQKSDVFITFSLGKGKEVIIYAGISVNSSLAMDGSDGRSPGMVTGGSWSMIAFMHRMRRYWEIATMVGRKQNMMIEIATIGDFTAITNCTDVKAKIPTAGMACKITIIIVPRWWEAPALAAMCRLMV